MYFIIYELQKGIWGLKCQMVWSGPFVSPNHGLMQPLLFWTTSVPQTSLRRPQPTSCWDCTSSGRAHSVPLGPHLVPAAVLEPGRHPVVRLRRVRQGSGHAVEREAGRKANQHFSSAQQCWDYFSAAEDLELSTCYKSSARGLFFFLSWSHLAS